MTIRCLGTRRRPGRTRLRYRIRKGPVLSSEEKAKPKTREEKSSRLQGGRWSGPPTVEEEEKSRSLQAEPERPESIHWAYRLGERCAPPVLPGAAMDEGSTTRRQTVASGVGDLRIPLGLGDNGLEGF